jgi:translation elongation factor EF-Tu-like GTPase
MRAYKTVYNFTALLSLLPTGNGGRKRPVYNHYRPSFSFSTANQFSGEIAFVDQEELKPGGTAKIEVKLLPSRYVPLKLKGGDSFTIMEGNKVVGTGVIQEIRDERRIPASIAN